MEENIKPKREFLATVFIVNNRKVLLTFNKKVQNYVPLGGHIDENELPCDCAVREAKEESGYDIELVNGNNLKNNKIPQNFGIGLDIIKPDHHHINLAYIGKIIGGKEMEQSDEETELKWFSEEELENAENLFEDVKEKSLKSIKIMEEMREPQQGEMYQHFKGTKGEIICIARNCEKSDEKFVVYKHLERIREIPENSIWIREINDFCGDKIFEEDCEYDGKKFKKGDKVKRFTLIKK